MTQTSSDENCIHILENKVSYKVRMSNFNINIIRSILYSQGQYHIVKVNILYGIVKSNGHGCPDRIFVVWFVVQSVVPDATCNMSISYGVCKVNDLLL